MRRLEGKTAVITGCNRGIGKAILERFASDGANIIAVVRHSDETLEKILAQKAIENNVDIKILEMDLSDEESVRDGMRKITLWKLSVDILVNNAGKAAGGFLLTTPIKVVKDVFQVNYFSQLIITQHVVKNMMRKKSGSIIFMSSVLGLDAMGGGAAYGASKAAVALLTKSLAKEVGNFGIRVNAIAPNLINTDMAHQMEEKSFKSMVSASSLDRIGEPGEIASVAAFLASDESSYITGQIIRVDGGM